MRRMSNDVLTAASATKFSGRCRLDDEDDEASSRARKAVRSNNFTGQTNILDVDKHMFVSDPFTFSFH